MLTVYPKNQYLLIVYKVDILKINYNLFCKNLKHIQCGKYVYIDRYNIFNHLIFLIFEIKVDFFCKLDQP